MKMHNSRLPPLLTENFDQSEIQSPTRRKGMRFQVQSGAFAVAEVLPRRLLGSRINPADPEEY